LTLWKKSLPQKAVPKSKDSPDRFRELKKEISVLRKQGEPPAKDPRTFSQYQCDLCSTSHQVSELRQCVLCGRWACDACWKEDLYTCRSCAGLIKIHSLVGRE
jgi:hypothetical protein